MITQEELIKSVRVTGEAPAQTEARIALAAVAVDVAITREGWYDEDADYIRHALPSAGKSGFDYLVGLTGDYR